MRSVVRHHIRIRPEEALAVEVDHVVGVIGDPDLGFPGDVRENGYRSPNRAR